ncbi:hypothetical protein [Pseudomonas typographi]|uniref:Uncharacterized protein n=1 Tax=Pseudomonas typographi TaxID=2715964 RepID=A0ABR7YXF7_9PSED|nr:hypothetical protein [Pseudomonas typographi]MBD1550951.1 hypothetical protein [Pseudomonas typographi]MBD1585776.1 hypothetical protein [Pseudomonas typographi]MBD1597850.1 hypothetical protein [Pseudomonas typographi]
MFSPVLRLLFGAPLLPITVLGLYGAVLALTLHSLPRAQWALGLLPLGLLLALAQGRAACRCLALLMLILAAALAAQGSEGLVQRLLGAAAFLICL